MARGLTHSTTVAQRNVSYVDTTAAAVRIKGTTG